MVFFVGNDVFQAHPDFVTRVWLGSPRTQLRSPWRVGPSGDYFYAYKMLRSGTRWLRNRLGRASGETFSRQIYLEIELRSLPVCRVEPDAGLEAGIRHAVELLAEMKAETERRGQGFLVVLAPDRFQIEEELRTKLLALAGESADRYDFDRPQTRLSAALEPLDVEVLDLLPAFREFAAAEALYLRRDTHWNARGNALAAEAVYRFVTERLDGPGLL